MKATTSLIACVALLCAGIHAASAEQKVAARIAQGRPAGSYKPTVYAASGARLPAGLRTAQAGTVNFIVMVGNAKDGCEEYRYAKAQAEAVGGFFFHGAFGIDDVVQYAVACAKKGTKIDNVYFIGHMSELTHDNLAEQLKPRDAAWSPVVQKNNDKGQPENRVGFVHPGYAGDNPGIDHFTNWNRDAFVGKLEKALADAGVRPDQAFTDRCRVVFRVCETGVFARKLLDELATLIPVGGEVVGYDIPYSWNFTKYPLGITRFWPDPEQTQGRFTIPGSYQAPQPAQPAQPAQPPLAAGPGFGAPSGDQPGGLLGVGMTDPTAPAATDGADEQTVTDGIAAANKEPDPIDATVDTITEIGFDTDTEATVTDAGASE